MLVNERAKNLGWDQRVGNAGLSMPPLRDMQQQPAILRRARRNTRSNQRLQWKDLAFARRNAAPLQGAQHCHPIFVLSLRAQPSQSLSTGIQDQPDNQSFRRPAGRRRSEIEGKHSESHLS
jgi:hypothetical protein